MKRLSLLLLTTLIAAPLCAAEPAKDSFLKKIGRAVKTHTLWMTGAVVGGSLSYLNFAKANKVYELISDKKTYFNQAFAEVYPILFEKFKKPAATYAQNQEDITRMATETIKGLAASGDYRGLRFPFNAYWNRIVDTEVLQLPANTVFTPEQQGKIALYRRITNLIKDYDQSLDSRIYKFNDNRDLRDAISKTHAYVFCAAATLAAASLTYGIYQLFFTKKQDPKNNPDRTAASTV